MSDIKTKRIGSNTYIITNYGTYGDIGIYLDDSAKLLVYSEGDFTYLIEGIDLDEAEDFIDMLNNEPTDATWKKYNLDDDEVYDEFESYFGDIRSYIDGLRYIGLLPSSAKVSYDVDGEPIFTKFIREFLPKLV